MITQSKTEPGEMDQVDDDRRQQVMDDLNAAKPGDVFAYQQASGHRVLLVVARFEPTGIANTTGIDGGGPPA